MATSMTNLFNFGRPLPEPFEKLPNKKVKGAASKYGALEATLCASVLKGVNAFCACVNGTGQGAVGNIEGQRYVAEYKSSMGADTYHLVVYDASTGNFLASVYDRDTELMEQYTAQITSGVATEETYQEFLDKLEIGGIDQLVSMYQESLDTWLEATGN